MQFVRLNDIVLHYQVFGADSGKPVLVFANSLGTDFRIWRDVVVALAGEFTIVTYDKRGHGLSDAPPAPYTLDEHVSDVAGLLDHLRLRDVHFCGLSVGGLIAQGLYKARPDLIRALILCDTGHKIGTAEMWDERLGDVHAKGLEAMADGVMERWFTKEFRVRESAALRGYRAMLARQSVDGYAGTIHAIRNADLTDDCAKIGVPTLCVVGDQDLATPPELVRDMANRIPGARFVEIEGAGHIPCVEQPEALVALVRNFVADVAASRGV